MRIKFLLISLIFYQFNCFAQQVRINEAISSNSIFIDEDGDSPDWFELYNYGNESISLKNWSVSDKDDNPKKWIFPSFNFNTHIFFLTSFKI